MAASLRKVVDSIITNVIVFNDRAQITRTTLVDLPEGEHSLIYANLPSNLDKNSLQVKTAGVEAILQGVNFKREVIDKEPEPQNEDDAAREEREKTIDNLKREIEDVKLELVLLDEREAAVKTISAGLITKGTAVSKEDKQPAENAFHISQWRELLAFKQEETSQIIKERLRISREIKTKETEIQQLQSKQIRRPKPPVRPVECVQVTIKMPKAGTLKVALDYVLHSATWEPIYDLRVDSKSKQVVMCYSGMVKQWTAENWEDVEICLSTAKPNLGGQQPELDPWRVDFGYNSYSRVPRSRNAVPEVAMASNMMMQQMCVPQMECLELEPEPAVVQHAEVTAGACSATFTCAGKHTVKNDNDPVKIPIMQQPFVAHFRYSCVPKLAQRAYLKARIINNTEYQFLAGDANVFLDNYFVAKTNQQVVSPGQDWWVYLGVDEGISVKHKLISRKDADHTTLMGAGKKKRKVEFEYKLEIVNNKLTQEEIVVWDQLPISSNKEITVQVLEPEYKQNTDTLKKNDVDFFEWFLYLKQNEKKEIPFKFTVEWPADKIINGL